MTDMKKWADDYIANLDSMVNTPFNIPVEPGTSGTLAESPLAAANRLIGSGSTTSGVQNWVPLPVPPTHTSPWGAIKNIGSRAIDVASRGLYAAQNFIQGIAKNNNSPDSPFAGSDLGPWAVNTPAVENSFKALTGQLATSGSAFDTPLNKEISNENVEPGQDIAPSSISDVLTNLKTDASNIGQGITGKKKGSADQTWAQLVGDDRWAHTNKYAKMVADLSLMVGTDPLPITVAPIVKTVGHTLQASKDAKAAAQVEAGIQQAAVSGEKSISDNIVANIGAGGKLDESKQVNSIVNQLLRDNNAPVAKQLDLQTAAPNIIDEGQQLAPAVVAPTLNAVTAPAVVAPIASKVKPAYSTSALRDSVSSAAQGKQATQNAALDFANILNRQPSKVAKELSGPASPIVTGSPTVDSLLEGAASFDANGRVTHMFGVPVVDESVAASNVVNEIAEAAKAPEPLVAPINDTRVGPSTDYSTNPPDGFPYIDSFPRSQIRNVRTENIRARNLNSTGQGAARDLPPTEVLDSNGTKLSTVYKRGADGKPEVVRTVNPRAESIVPNRYADSLPTAEQYVKDITTVGSDGKILTHQDPLWELKGLTRDQAVREYKDLNARAVANGQKPFLADDVPTAVISNGQHVNDVIDSAATKAVADGDRSIPTAAPVAEKVAAAIAPDTAAATKQMLAPAGAAGSQKFLDVQSQAKIVQEATRESLRQASLSGGEEVINGAGRVQRGERVVLQTLGKIADKALANGIIPAIASSKDAAHAYPLFAGDVLAAASKYMDTPYHVATHVSHAATMLAPSSMLAGAARAMDLIGSPLSEADRVTDIVQHMAAADNRTKAALQEPGLAEEFAGAMNKAATRELIQAASANRTRILNKNTADTAHIFDQESGWVNSALLDPTNSPSVRANAVADIGRGIDQTAATVHATDQAKQAAGSLLLPYVAKLGVTQQDVEAARASLSVARDLSKYGEDAITSGKVGARVQASAAKASSYALSLAQQTLDQANRIALADTVEVGLNAEVSTNGIFSRMFTNVPTRLMGQAVSPALKDAIRTGTTVSMGEASAFRTTLAKVKNLSETDAKDAFSAMLSGKTPADETQALNTNNMVAVYNSMFDMSKGADASTSLIGVGFRNGATVDQLNEMLAAKGIKQQFDLGAAQKQFDAMKEAKTLKPGQSVMSTLADQWKQWNIADPVDFADRSYFGMQQLTMHQSVAADFAERFSVSPMVPGSKKIAQVPSLKSTLIAKYIPKDTVLSKDAIEQLNKMEQRMAKATNFRGAKGPAAAFINNFYDPAMNLFKVYSTVARPGHLLRDTLGDMFANMDDGVYSLKHYKTAINMLAQSRGFKGDVNALQELNKGKAVTGGDKAFTTTVGGKNVEVSMDRAYQLASQSGVMLGFHSIIDADNIAGGGIFNKLGKAMTDNKAINTLGSASEFASNGTRLAHFSALMDRTSFTQKFGSLEEASAAAARRVREVHPDPMGLSPGEMKYMRRIIPFYSWSRQILPFVMETMVTHPGRITSLSKASASIIQGSGGDIQGYGDQFPIDGLYPSFVTSHLTGPIGGATWDLGSPQEGVLGDSLLNGNPGRNILSMLSPLIKAPIELSTNTNLGTGSYIADKGEYFDAMTPGISQASTVSGVDILGSASNLVTGNYAGVPDPQRAVQKGEKSYLFNRSTMNFLLGLNSQAVDKPSYQKIARDEQ